MQPYLNRNNTLFNEMSGCKMYSGSEEFFRSNSKAARKMEKDIIDQYATLQQSILTTQIIMEKLNCEFIILISLIQTAHNICDDASANVFEDKLSTQEFNAALKQARTIDSSFGLCSNESSEAWNKVVSNAFKKIYLHSM